MSNKKPFKLILQLHKKSSGAGSTSSYKPTAQELQLQQYAVEAAQKMQPYVLGAAEYGWNILNDPNNYGTKVIDYGTLANNAVNQVQNAQQGIVGLQNGELPSAYQQNMEDSIRSGVQNTLGTNLNSLANRGVLNSSVMTAADKSIADATANAMAQQYGNNIGILSNLYGQQAGLAGQPITLNQAAQEAALYPTTTLWNAATSLNQGSTLGALNAVSGKGSTTTTKNDGGLFGQLLGVGLNIAASTYCFAGDTEISIPSEDMGGIGAAELICRMKPGDKVYCYDEDNDKFILETVTEVMPAHYSDVYLVATDYDCSVCTTLSQPFLLADKKTYKTVGMMCIGDELYCSGKVKSITHIGRRKVFDLKVSGKHNNYLANGFVAKGGTDEW